jgi:hypothetical protein
VLDPAVENLFSQGRQIDGVIPEYSNASVPYLLAGIRLLTFHPPQFSFSVS